MRASFLLILGAAAVVFAAAGGVDASVRINEFLADNEGSFVTAEGAMPDWIELHNFGNSDVNLTGWRMTDNASNLSKWVFPEGVMIEAGGFLVVLADGSAAPLVGGVVHSSLSLSKDGEYLALVRPDGSVANEFAPEFPPQLRDTSYGLAPKISELVGAGTAARYRVPNAAGNAPWTGDAKGALGFAALGGAFEVAYYELNKDINNVDDAEAKILNPANVSFSQKYSYALLNFSADGGSSYSFAPHAAFPNHSSTTHGKDRFVLVSESAIYVPEAGMWTFCVASDDGFRLRIAGHGASFVSEFLSGRGVDNTLATFNFPQTGVYDLSLSYYENGGGAALGFSVAKGWQANFSEATFKLVGDPAAGILHAGAIGSHVETDVGAAMTNVNSRLDAEWVFELAAMPAAGDRVTLAVRFADGFAASVNGVAVPSAAVNMPSAPLAWNSAATAARSIGDVMQWAYFDVPLSLLNAGANSLEITALNNSAADGDFLVQPRVVWETGALHALFFAEPTPGAPNSTRAFNAPTPAIAASEPRGYKTEAFAVELSAPSPSAGAGAPLIRYTLDGSVPTMDNGFTYDPAAPLQISQTTVLRAAAPDAESIRQTTSTHTWIFLDDVIRQGSEAPAGWAADGAVNSHKMLYGMRPAIVDGADAARLLKGVTNSPVLTLSLVTELGNLFNPQSGIYVNPGNDGRAWERPVSVELIDPARGAAGEFHIDAGLRIRGAHSRSTGNPKHSLRLFFRSVYGDGKLRFPLFGDEGAEEFDKVDLRTESNYSWAFENSDRNTLVREVFSRDTQRDMGVPYTRSRYYHLYINGLYWGIYQTQERAEAAYAETYLGGAEADWDTIKTSNPGYSNAATDGNMDAWNALHALAVVQGFAGANSNNYWRARGLHPDGTRNPAYPVLLDQDNLIAYIISAHYAGDPDSPVSAWGGHPNNINALYNRAAPDGFKWLRHDAEHSLGSRDDYGANADTTQVGANFTEQNRFNPNILHNRLCAHPEYRRRYADLARQYLFDDGPLAPANSIARFQARMDEIDDAIVAESARWGNGKDRSTWLRECNRVLTTYLDRRRETLIAQLKANGWYPAIDPPSYTHNNATLPAGALVRLFGDAPFYYTLDGADPRLPDGALNPAALPSTSRNAAPSVPLVQRGDAWKFYDAGNLPHADWTSPAYDDSGWGEGPAVLGFAGSGNVNDIGTQTRRQVNSQTVTTTYFRHNFTLAEELPPDAAFTLNLLRDDGAIIYVNGVEILRDNMPGGTIGYGTYSSSTIGDTAQTTYNDHYPDIARHLHAGVNTIAVEIHQCNKDSTDLYFDLDLTASITDAHYAEHTLAATTTIRARAHDPATGDWSALSQTALAIEGEEASPYAGIRITEIMFAAGDYSPYASDDCPFLKLENIGSESVDLENCYFVGIDHVFGNVTLPPGGALYLARNLAAFAHRYGDPGIPVIKWTSGNLARNGEAIQLLAPDESIIISLSYDRYWFMEATRDTGRYLVARDTAPCATNAYWSTEAAWRLNLLDTSASPYAALRVTELMFAPPKLDSTYANDDFAYLKLVNTGATNLNLQGCSFYGINHTFGDVDLAAGATLHLVKNPAAYIQRYGDPGVPLHTWASGNFARNGEYVELRAPDNKPFIAFFYTSDWFDFAAYNTGRYIIALDLAPSGADLIWSTPDNWQLNPLAPAPSEYAALRITELMYAPPNSAGASDRDDFAFLKIANTSAAEINLQGCFLTMPKHTFGDTALAAGASLILSANAAAFAARYGVPSVPILQWTSGRFDRDGQLVQLFDPGTNAVVSFTNSDSWFNGLTKNTGRYLIALDLQIPGADPAWSAETNWRLSPLRPIVSNIRIEGANFVIATDSIAPYFGVKYTDSLTNGAVWTTVPPAAITTDNGEITIDTSALPDPGSPARFFRVFHY